MPASELVYWETRYEREFMGDERADWHAAQICATVANFAGKSLKDGVDSSPLEYMAFSEQPEPEPVDVADKLRFAMGGIMAVQKKITEKTNGTVPNPEVQQPRNL